MACLLGIVVVAAVACSSQTGAVAWIATGDRAAFPSPLTVDNATAITIDETFLYWITTDAFLYRVPRTGGAVVRVPLPAPGMLVRAHDDVYVGWTDDSGNAAIAEIDPATGKVSVVNHQAGHLRGLVAGQRGYSFATAAATGTLVQTCLEGVCPQQVAINSDFESLALDLPTKTFYVLTADGLRACTLDAGCPTEAATPPASTSLIIALPGAYFLLTSSGQAYGMDGASLGSAAVPGPTKFWADDGNGPATSPVGTWSNGSALAQCLLAPGTTTTELPVACADIDVDATGRPIYCLAGSSSIQIIP
jgi:hypothetical protein